MQDAKYQTRDSIRQESLLEREWQGRETFS